MAELSNTEIELKKSVGYKESGVSFSFTNKMLFGIKPLLEKNNLTDFQKVLLSDTI